MGDNYIERSLGLRIRLNKNAPVGFTIYIDDHETATTALIFGQNEDEKKEDLWSEVMEWVKIMQDEEQEEE